MARVLSSIHIRWDDKGTISHSISGGYPEDHQNVLYVLAPSVPMLVSHQLGVLQPSRGLLMCEKLLDLLQYGTYRHAPIDSALRSARIVWRQTGHGVTIAFHPRTKFLAADKDIELGVCQLAYNYAYYVMSRVPDDVKDSVKSFTALAIHLYLDTLDGTLNKASAGSGPVRWHLGLSRAMATASRYIAEEWSPGLEPTDESQPGTIEERLDRVLAQLRTRHHEMCQRMGITTHWHHG